RLDTIPGINQRTAEVILAEVGTDMRVFPSARHLASWAALCPGQHESAGKHKSGKTRTGNGGLRTALIEAAAGASRAKNSALQARFRRVLRHRGAKKAVGAGAHRPLRWRPPCRGAPRPGRRNGLSRSRRRLLRPSPQPAHRAARPPDASTPGLPCDPRSGILNLLVRL